MSLDSPRAQYRQLADLLRQAIESGEYAAGSTLPAEPQLAERYSVSRLTVNRAVSILRSEGLVRVDRGRGTIVRDLPILRRDAAARQRTDVRESGGARGAFQGELARLGLSARSEVAVDQVPASDSIARLLSVDEGVLVLARRRHMFADDVPVQLATSYISMEIAAGTQLMQPDTGPGGAYSRLAELGHEPAEFTESVKVRLPDDQEAKFLRMDAEQRVFAIRRLARSAKGRIVEVNDIVLPAHQWELVYDWQS